MSDLSVFLHKVGAFFATPAVAAVPGVADAASALAAAATAVESALPGVAKVAADAALAAAGPIGVAATPFANNFIDLLIAELTQRKTVTFSPASAKAPAASSANG